MWAAFPPLKMCGTCLLQKKLFAHVEYNEGRKLCGLSTSDLAGLPIVEVGEIPSPRTLQPKPTNTLDFYTQDLPPLVLILRHNLRQVARENGSAPSSAHYRRSYRFTEYKMLRAPLQVPRDFRWVSWLRKNQVFCCGGSLI